jgi:hypothetical protein
VKLAREGMIIPRMIYGESEKRKSGNPFIYYPVSVRSSERVME